jgi:hypothetical protein
MPKEPLERVTKNTRMLIEAARVLAVSVLVSEQYPRGLGPTIPEIRQIVISRGIPVIDKLDFDAAAEPKIAREIGRLAPRSVVVVGMEAHVCVFQTARELVRRGFDVHVVSDAVVSRSEENRLAGLALAERAGATVTVAEAVVFDWVGRAGTPAFRAVSKLVK